jgi:hypothetical protein
MSEIGIVDAIEAVRSELLAAMASQGSEIQFPIVGVQIEFQIGVTKGGQGGLKARAWVLELGTDAKYEHKSVHTVTLSLGAPIDERGDTIKVYRRSTEKP